MWSCTGHRADPAARALAALAALAAACTSEPDVVLRVTRPGTHQVLAIACDTASPAACGADNVLFDTGEPAASVRTLGLYLDGTAPPVSLRFVQQAPTAFCDALELALTTLPLDVELALPASAAETLVVPTDCAGCNAGACQ